LQRGSCFDDFNYCREIREAVIERVIVISIIKKYIGTNSEVLEVTKGGEID